MLFNSNQFLVFFPTVAILFFLLPHKFRWAHLLIASCIFYAAFIPIYLLILFGTIVIDYIAGILIENAEGAKRKAWLAVSIIANVGVLAVFKYYNFFIQNLNVVFHTLPILKIALPIGLSFHTFQAMSYTIEVYRKNQKCEKHFGIYALYVMFFPQLVAGPIERPQNILHQFHERQYFNYDNAVNGLRLMLWGFFKKIVIADRLAIITDPIFNDPYHHTPVAMIIGTIFFSFQIFCDFSGYSDIALGSAKVMGFTLMQNFERPYTSKSISEFWSRWHISLSTWFRDYLYIPLGGNRVSVPRWYFNLFFVFLVSGFWHGANWTFILWGALHGFYLIFAIISAPIRTKLNKIIGLHKVPWLNHNLQRLTTFSLVAFAWIFFRANHLKDAFYIIQKIPDAAHQFLTPLMEGKIHEWYFNDVSLKDYWLAVASILLMELVHHLQQKNTIPTFIQKQPITIRWAAYYFLILTIILFGVFEKRQFIYFQF